MAEFEEKRVAQLEFEGVEKRNNQRIVVELSPNALRQLNDSVKVGVEGRTLGIHHFMYTIMFIIGITIFAAVGWTSLVNRVDRLSDGVGDLKSTITAKGTYERNIENRILQLEDNINRLWVDNRKKRQ